MTKLNRMSASCVVQAGSPGPGRSTFTPATPFVFVLIVVSRATKPGRRAGAPGWTPAPTIVHEALALPFAVGAELGCRQGHVMVDFGDMLGGNADLDHLDPVGRVQHPVADFGGLDEAVAGGQPDGPP